MSNNQLTAVSLFTGAGGMDVGFERAGIKVVFANELMKEATQTYRANHPNSLMVKLSSPLMLENINTILKNNPALLETWQIIALEDILGRELIVDSCYVPIGGQALRKNLMSLSV